MTDPTMLVELATTVHLTFYQHNSCCTVIYRFSILPSFVLSLIDGSEFYNKDAKS